MEFKKYRANGATRHFEYLTKLIFILTAKNFWYEDVKLPGYFVKIYKSVTRFLEAFFITILITGPFARFTQHNLDEKQSTDVLLRNLTNLFVYTLYSFTLYHKETIKELLFTLTVTLKGLYNDETVERKMIKKTWMYLAVLLAIGSCSVITYGAEDAVNALTSNATFIPVITIWPDIEDRSLSAVFARILIYIVVVFLVVPRGISTYGIISYTSICLGYQFANLSEYFLSLNDIFNGEGSQEEKEIKYEKAFKVGIKMHIITLNCVHQLESSFRLAYSGQLVASIGALALILIQVMRTERSLEALAPILLQMASILLTSGLFIWSAADITVEAERLPTAMFHSGWHNCRRQSSVRVRKLITIAMAQAQQVVVIKGLFIFELSYSYYVTQVVVIKGLFIFELSYSYYVTIVKTSYSVFSMIY